MQLAPIRVWNMQAASYHLDDGCEPASMIAATSIDVSCKHTHSLLPPERRCRSHALQLETCTQHSISSNILAAAVDHTCQHSVPPTWTQHASITTGNMLAALSFQDHGCSLHSHSLDYPGTWTQLAPMRAWNIHGQLKDACQPAPGCMPASNHARSLLSPRTYMQLASITTVNMHSAFCQL